LEAPQDARPIVSADRSTVEGGKSKVRAGEIRARWGSAASRRLGSDTARASLQWRDPGSATEAVAKTQPSQVVQAATIKAGEHAAPRLRSFVRPASQLAPLDPFDDPFNDQAVQEANEPTSILQPERVEDEPPTPPSSSFPSNRFETIQPDPQIDRDPVDRGLQIYNRRNCADDLERCEQAREYVASNPITNISLDITPPFTLAKIKERDNGEYQQELEMGLDEVPVRDYRDRQGEVVARGRLRGFEHGRVLIADESGEITDVPFSDLSDDDMCFIAAWWSIPTECPLGDDEFKSRQWLASTMTWQASGVCHKPLYFEEVQLERYGHSAGPIVQPVLSGAGFVLNVLALPYHAGIHPPNECQYPLGYYRPGSCAPWLMPPIPLSLRAGLLAAGVYVGGVFAIP
jgi:hypothetical protein